ncbi:hypothetical protein Slin15195_G054640 [Septoria linicola]|uniref:Uncharacterized protein n=1 Tax=Septoria linicola TaxID=215465 RepID=A0A9Q9AND3_9PEZI|nr:hypothetical protein Slin14017_G125460 [Septoria linicola]USW52145.1 hypothetical protein Slin15195_G054640 [Septoria linicola]
MAEPGWQSHPRTISKSPSAGLLYSIDTDTLLILRQIYGVTGITISAGWLNRAGSLILALEASRLVLDYYTYLTQLLCAQNLAPLPDSQEFIANMKRTLAALTLFLGSSAYAKPLSTCVAPKDGTGTGHCLTYESEGGPQLTDLRTVCRKAKPCVVNGNGCWANFENIEGGWYGNCS